MSATKWTNEQWDAITERDCNLLVAAAAGAGKTAVLVERIIRKITDEKNPVDIDRMLIVTFTNAAATEMRERIAEAISEVLDKNPDSRLIQRQLALLGKASITTIHSFCMEVIRSNFQAINIDPNFRIADETESSLMKLEALNDLFEEQYEKENNTEFFELLECYGGNRDDQALMEMVSGLHSFIQSSPRPDEWLRDMTERLNVPEGTDFGKTVWGSVLLQSVKLELSGIRDMMARAVELVRTGLGLEKYLPVFKADLLTIDSLLALNSSWDDMYSCLRSLEFETLPRASKDVDKDRQETVKKIRDEMKKRLKKLTEKVVSADSESILKDLKLLYPKMKCLAGLVTELTRRYTEKKNKKSVVDFNDLEHYCLEILMERGEDGSIRPSPAAMSYRERFDEILVDEYQDSNLVQEMMISMISRADTDRPNVFMVGDVKQSIYRFRQARPELFLEKYNTYSSDKGSLFRKILLFKNFRSRKEVVDAVNFIFKQIMSADAGELDYTDTEALNPGASFPDNTCEEAWIGGEAELHLIQTSNGPNDEAEANDEEEAQEGEQAEEEILDNIQCEARLVARRIHELMRPDASGKYLHVFDKSRKAYRRVQFRDIVILLRTTRNWSDVFADELALEGIPAFADAGGGFFKTVEIQVILSLLMVIDNPLQDIPLLSVLRSPIYAFTTDELAELRLEDRRAPLFEALKMLAERNDSKAAKKASIFLKNLKSWREMALYLSTDQLIWKLYNDTGYYGMVGAMPAGEQRQANLRILFERARTFEATSYKGLFNFISFIDKLKSGKGDMGSAKTLSENDDVVRIMSIHKSKGLEFPVVFLSGCGKKFNLQDMNKSILLHQDLGFGPDVVDHKLRISWPSAAKQAIREKIKTETLSEEMRILYVALTRAREKLIITGAVNDAGKALQKWLAAASIDAEKLPPYEMLKSSNYLDWICPPVLRHEACGGLRDLAPIGTDTGVRRIADDSKWSVRLWSRNDVVSNKGAAASTDDEFLAYLDELLGGYPRSENIPAQISLDDVLKAGTPSEALAEELERRLRWEYTYIKTSAIPAKISVTELKRRFNRQASDDNGALPGQLPVLVKKPKFMEARAGLSAAEKGTILHFIMQHLDFENRDIRAQIDSMVAKDLLTPQQASGIDLGRITAFLESSLGKRMLASSSIQREIPFNIEIPCCELYSDMAGDACRDETVLLQGVIDCFFEEPDGIVLVDYKTDHVPSGKTHIIKERYKLQLEYYARALKMLTGRKVKEKVIYLFWNGEILQLD